MLYRLTIFVPLQYINYIRSTFGEWGQKSLLLNIKWRLQDLGFQDIKTVIQDPTNPENFTAIARGQGKTQDNVIKIVKKEQVEEPATIGQSPIANHILDPGLISDETWAIRYALLHEQNPRHLLGFASTFEPFYPVAASLLRSKSFLRECEALRNRTKLIDENRKAGRRAINALAKIGSQIGQDVLIPRERINYGNILSNLTLYYTQNQWQDVARMWERFRHILPNEWYGFRKFLVPESDLRKLYTNLVSYSIQSKIPLDILIDEVKRAACIYIDEPQLLLEDSPKTPTKNTTKEKIRELPKPVTDFAKALITEIGLGLWILDPVKVYRLFGCESKFPGYVSPSALQLALASNKPEWSGISDKSKIGRIFNNLSADQNQNQINALRAGAQMERAKKAIERRRWIEWYRRYEKLRLSS